MEPSGLLVSRANFCQSVWNKRSLLGVFRVRSTCLCSDSHPVRRILIQEDV